MESRAGIERTLREHGMRVTQQRVAVLEVLSASKRHPTAEEVGAAVPTASRASIYNVLHSLREAGLVEELVFDDALARYDANLAPHHHFICTGCRAVEDVDWAAFPDDRSGTTPDGHVIAAVTVTFRGLCPACAGRS